MTKLLEMWSNPIAGCQEVRVGNLVRPAYFCKEEPEYNPSCIIQEIDTENQRIVLKENRIDGEKYPRIYIEKEQFNSKYAFFKMI